jgi:hypothetical protein
MNRYFIIPILLLCLTAICCEDGKHAGQDTDAFAIKAYIYLMTKDYRSVDNLPRAHTERSHEDLYSIAGREDFIGVGELLPHVQILDIWEWPTMPNQKMYVLTFDDEGKDMIMQWAGSAMTEGWEGLLSSEYKLTIGLRDGEPYLVGF